MRGGRDPVSVGVDSWAIDYGLVDESARLLARPHHYRDSRTDGVTAKVHAVVGEESLYETTGLQYLPFTTIYQLATELGTRCSLLPSRCCSSPTCSPGG